MTHAGFWVDGAVRLPDDKHFDCNGWVVANWKDKNLDLDICQKNFDKWSEVYWLDTTPRESLTPEELFSVVKVIFPEIKHVKKDSWAIDYLGDSVKVDWDGLTQYPPSELKWVLITRENVGQYLFRDCRFKNLHEAQWKNGKIAGWDDQDNCCLVNSDSVEHMPIVNWSIVEVQA